MEQIIIGIIIVLLGFYCFKFYEFKTDVKSLVMASLLIIITVILKRMSLMLPLFGVESLKIGFEMLPMMIGGVLLSPGYGFIMGIAVDMIGLIIVPTGFPFLGFTLSSILQAVIPAVISNKLKIEKVNLIKNGITIGLILLLVGASVYISQINTITVSKEVVEITSSSKALMIVACLIFMGVLIFVINYFKNKISEESLLLFYKWIVVVVLVEICISLCLTPLWLDIMYGIPFMLSSFLRVVKACIMIPIDIIVGFSVLRIIEKI